MNSERWKRIDELFCRVLDQPEHARTEYLRDACGGDQTLQREVSSLLEADGAVTSFLQSPAIRSIAHYRIVEVLGSGGMGVVYKAVDTRLNRTVALKMLPLQLCADADLNRRLLDEARAASALDHPNIVVIHDIGESADGRMFIAMAYHEGVTLRERLANGKLDTEEALRIALQIASGLAKAHERGIVHRDIKPSNIMLSPEGEARIIDFGLAKYSDVSATVEGIVCGTPMYMSPEQASGKPLDARTDLWSLGLVLYEMLAARTRSVDDSSVTIAGLPASVQRILDRALQKDVEKRYASASEMARDLSAALGSRLGSSRWRTAAVAAGVIVMATVWLLYSHRTPPKLTDRDAIVLGDFRNETGDPVFDGTLRQALAIQLGESPFLVVLPEDKVQHALSLMGQKADAQLTPKVAQEVCERTGSAAVLEGSIARIGSEYVVGLRAQDCRMGTLLDEQQVQASRKENVLKVLGEMATRFRSRTGESLANVKAHSMLIEEASTPSLEALREYSRAQRMHRESGNQVLPLFLRAVELDPNFAIAHTAVGWTYTEQGELEKGAESFRKGFALRDRASGRERFLIESAYQMNVTGNIEQAQRTCELWRNTYPRERDAYASLASFIYPGQGQYERALEAATRGVEIDPDYEITYNLKAMAQQSLGRYAEAEKTLDAAAVRKIDIPDLVLARFWIAFLKGDSAGMARVAETSRGKPGTEDWVVDQQGFVAAYGGRLREAKRHVGEAVRQVMQAGQNERAAQYEAGPAIWEALFGEVEAARRDAAAVLSKSHSREVSYGAAFALAIAGEATRPLALAGDLSRRYPENTAVQFSYVPVIQAASALTAGQANRALRELEAARYELGTPPSVLFGNFGALYPVYLRGLAYLRMGRGTEAAAEFRKILKRLRI
ncbi:MAG: protein kinase [Bryobacteraceae bacterium]